MPHYQTKITPLLFAAACLILLFLPAAGAQDTPSKPKNQPSARESQIDAKTQSKSTKESTTLEPEARSAQEALEEAAVPDVSTDSFTFLDIGPNSEIDITRKRQFADYRVLTERSCTGCLCTHAFGNRLSESWNLLYGRSEPFKSIWDQIAVCIKERFNAIPQIRSILLKARYVDTEFQTVAFFFSEFTHKPVCFRMEMNNPKTAVALLAERYGEPQPVENTWLLWEKGKDLMLLDLFLVNTRQHDTARLRVFFGENLAEHLREVEAQAALLTRP